MLTVAAHAVTATCSRCGSRVRSTVEIARQVAELEEVLRGARLLSLGRSQAGASVSATVRAAVRDEYARLAAELAGDHAAGACGVRALDVDALRRELNEALRRALRTGAGMFA